MSLVLDIPVERLATTLAPLRGPRTDAGTSLAPLPLRVAPAGDDTYEVLDGFKRLARWRHEGHTHVPVVVEDAGAGVVGKARLLEANTPRRTVSPMDEARVVRALRRRSALGHHREPAGQLPPWRAEAARREHRAPRAAHPRGRRRARRLGACRNNAKR